MAGFSRTNIQGHTLVANPELVKIMRRKSSATLGSLFREAQEHGQSRIELDGKIFTIVRKSDHTFTVEAESEHRGFL